ncbi:biotin transporter BioY [Frigidibacter sp. MR17.24]|uniref:biotin transporter BioY n=1 Tax=Frigidibacter sp. MR17.24 TaxID=3127345 RepID=UPI003012DD62
MTLTQALVPSQGRLARAALVLGASALIAVAAQVTVPMVPVPMTLQTLAILTVGFALGARLGTAALVTYLAEGAMGLPVFAHGGSTAALIGPAAGFLLGFVAMAAVAGFAADRGVRGFVGTALVALAASALIYVPGLAWPALVMGKSVPDLMSGWMMPFLGGDAVKALLAALIVSGAWGALAARRG